MKDWDPRYDALLHRPRPLSPDHPAMLLRERAAQFAAFQALTGFEEEIEEEGRYTEEAVELTEESRAILNERLCRLAESGRQASFVWFRPDGRKAGGSYCLSRAAVKKIDPFERQLYLDNGERLALDWLYEIDESGPAGEQGAARTGRPRLKRI